MTYRDNSLRINYFFRRKLTPYVPAGPEEYAPQAPSGTFERALKALKDDYGTPYHTACTATPWAGRISGLSI